MFKHIVVFFDKLEDRIRGRLSRSPVLYTFIGGTALVLFWRGVWHTADILQARGGWLGWVFYEATNLIIVVIILLCTGLFVSYFIGDTIILSGMKGEKKLTEKTEREVKEEESEIAGLTKTVDEIKKEVEEIKDIVEHEHSEHHGGEKK